MAKLVAAADLTVWGWGCETKPRLHVRCEPLDGGAWLEVTTHGTYSASDPEAKRGERRENLLVDAFELDRLLNALTDADLVGRVLPDGLLDDLSSAGSAHLFLPLATGAFDVGVHDDEAARLMAVADLVLALAERAGMRLPPAFHPFLSWPGPVLQSP